MCMQYGSYILLTFLIFQFGIALSFDQEYGINDRCAIRCRGLYPNLKEESGAENPECSSCCSGCRYFRNLSRLSASTGEYRIDDALNQTYANCNQTCEREFNKNSLEIGCKMGCGFAVPFIKAEIQESNVFESFPLINLTPQLSVRGFPIFNSLPSLRMNQMFQKLSQNIFGNLFATEDEDEEDGEIDQVLRVAKTLGAATTKDGKGGPKNIMIKVVSGPGFKRVEIGQPYNKFSVGSFFNDMVNRMNPLDTYFNRDRDVEVVDTSIRPVEENKDDNNELMISSESNVDKFDKMLEVLPRLPVEGGLRSSVHYSEQPQEPLDKHERLVAYYRPQKCDDNSLPWYKCIRLVRRFPHWSYIGIICLAFMLILWLCFAIPSSKRYKARQCAMSKADLMKESEAQFVVAVSCQKDPLPVDLPPAYEDTTAALSVKLEDKLGASPKLDVEANKK